MVSSLLLFGTHTFLILFLAESILLQNGSLHHVPLILGFLSAINFPFNFVALYLYLGQQVLLLLKSPFFLNESPLNFDPLILGMMDVVFFDGYFLCKVESLVADELFYYLQEVICF